MVQSHYSLCFKMNCVLIIAPFFLLLQFPVELFDSDLNTSFRFISAARRSYLKLNSFNIDSTGTFNYLLLQTGKISYSGMLVSLSGAKRDLCPDISFITHIHKTVERLQHQINLADWLSQSFCCEFSKDLLQIFVILFWFPHILPRIIPQTNCTSQTRIQTQWLWKSL